MRDTDEEQIRIDLAATFRIIAHVGMHEAVANPFRAALSADGKTFLLNPKWKHFSRIRASDLLVLNADDERCAARPDVDATAWAIHGQIHQRLPDVRVVLHLHPAYTTSLACLATPQILPIDQNTARYYNRVAVDTLYGGMADTAAEGARLAGLLADKFGRRSSMIVITSLIILFALFVFPPLLGSGSPALVMAYLLIGLSLMGLTFGPMGALLPELFPTEVRYTGASFSYNVSSILGASVAPYIATWLQANYGLFYVGVYLAAMAALTLIALLLTHETKHQAL